MAEFTELKVIVKGSKERIDRLENVVEYIRSLTEEDVQKVTLSRTTSQSWAGLLFVQKIVERFFDKPLIISGKALTWLNYTLNDEEFARLCDLIPCLKEKGDCSDAIDISKFDFLVDQFHTFALGPKWSYCKRLSDNEYLLELKEKWEMDDVFLRFLGLVYGVKVSFYSLFNIEGLNGITNMEPDILEKFHDDIYYIGSDVFAKELDDISKTFRDKLLEISPLVDDFESKVINTEALNSYYFHNDPSYFDDIIDVISSQFKESEKLVNAIPSILKEMNKSTFFDDLSINSLFTKAKEYFDTIDDETVNILDLDGDNDETTPDK